MLTRHESARLKFVTKWDAILARKVKAKLEKLDLAREEHAMAEGEHNANAVEKQALELKRDTK